MRTWSGGRRPAPRSAATRECHDVAGSDPDPRGIRGDRLRAAAPAPGGGPGRVAVAGRGLRRPLDGSALPRPGRAAAVRPSRGAHRAVPAVPGGAGADGVGPTRAQCPHRRSAHRAGVTAEAGRGVGRAADPSACDAPPGGGSRVRACGSAGQGAALPHSMGSIVRTLAKNPAYGLGGSPLRPAPESTSWSTWRPGGTAPLRTPCFTTRSYIEGPSGRSGRGPGPDTRAASSDRGPTRAVRAGPGRWPTGTRRICSRKPPRWLRQGRHSGQSPDPGPLAA